MSDGLRIGALAKRADCPVETIRYYEQAGLLPKPARSQGNYRLYSNVHVERLTFIRHCRSLDMTLKEIRTLLRFCDAPAKNCGEVNALLDEHIGHVAERIDELKKLEDQLKDLRALCSKTRAAKDCGILNKLTENVAARAQKKTNTGHVHGAHARGGK
jgi:Cd(II)/Pb(II)-responsive transcriptional regulator